MAQLKAGRAADFSNSMAEAIEIALQQEWQAVKGVAPPADGEAERRVLFVAIARGILQYLKAHDGEILTSITLDTSSPAAVADLDLNYSGA